MTPRRRAPPPMSATVRATRRWPVAPTRRGCVLIGLGLLWVIPAWIDPRAVAFMFLWNLVVIATFVIDLRQLPKPELLRVTRRWTSALAIGVPATVSLELHNGGDVPIRARLTDYLNPALRPHLDPADVRVAPRMASSVSSEISPRERGDTNVGEVVVEWRSVWGLVERWAQAPMTLPTNREV